MGGGDRMTLVLLGDSTRSAPLERPLARTAEQVNAAALPRQDVAHRHRGTVGDAADLGRCQDPVPQVEVGQLAYEGLSGIVPPPRCVLYRERTGGWGNR